MNLLREKYEQKVNKLKAELFVTQSNASKKVNECSSLLDEYHDDLQNERNNSKSLKAEIKSLEGQLVNKSKNLVNLKRDLTDQLEVKDKEVKSFQEKIGLLMCEKNETEQKINDMLKALNKMRQYHISIVKKLNEQANQVKESFVQQINNMTAIENVLKGKVETLEDQVDQMKNRAKELSAVVIYSKERRREVEREKTEAKEEVADLESKMYSIQSKLYQISCELETKSKELKDAQDYIEATDEKNCNLIRKLKYQHQVVDDRDELRRKTIELVSIPIELLHIIGRNFLRWI